VSNKPVSSKPTSPPTPLSSLNLCLIRGETSAEPELRVLASGTRLAVLSVRVRTTGAPATSVPVAVWDPPARVEALEPGTEVVVVGRVVRRFFRTATGGPGSRVEVQADLVTPAGDRRKLTQALRRAERVLDALVDDGT
jgi:single-stranded DNA-binding protein